MEYISNGRLIFDAKGKQVAQCEEYGDASVIVRACNAHEGLVAALNELSQYVLHGVSEAATRRSANRAADIVESLTGKNHVQD